MAKQTFFLKLVFSDKEEFLDIEDCANHITNRLEPRWDVEVTPLNATDLMADIVDLVIN